MIETIIARIRIAMNLGVSRDEIRVALNTSAEDFFLAWHAAEILEKDICKSSVSS